MEQMKAVRGEANVKLNDVLLAVVGGRADRKPWVPLVGRYR
jgi:hypothetical protein